MTEQERRRRKLIATLTVVLPVVAGIIIVALGHFLGHETGEVAKLPANEEVERRAAPAPAAAGTPAPRVRLGEGATERRFDSASLGKEPRAVVFISTACDPIGDYLGRAVHDLRGGSAAVLAISSDPGADAPRVVAAWLAEHHLKSGAFHFLVGDEDELRGYWNAWGFDGPAKSCSGSVPAHLVNGAGENAGIVDLDPSGSPSVLTDALAGMAK